MANAFPETVVSHWSTLIEDFQTSPLGFYEAVEAALARRDIPNTERSRVDYHEAGLLSANREYLRIRREKLLFDICAAPFGTGFFVSWWLAEDVPQLTFLAKIGLSVAFLAVTAFLMYQAGIMGGLFVLAILTALASMFLQAFAAGGGTDDSWIESIPGFGALYVRVFKPHTYYRIDTMKMFQTMVHHSVMEVIDGLTSAKGLRALSQDERKPLMREFYDRAA